MSGDRGHLPLKDPGLQGRNMHGAVSHDIPDCVPPDPAPHPLRFQMPAGACDCHAHVSGPESRYPLSPTRLYSPTGSSMADYRTMLNAIGVGRAVLVQPSFYGSDNSALLDALGESPATLRGIAVIDGATPAAELERLHAAGIRGVRFNIVDQREGKGVFPGDLIRTLSPRLADLGWHVELLVHVDDFPGLDQLVSGLPVDVVVAHMGYLHRQGSRRSDGFRALLRLLDRRKAWVKLSGPYRVSAFEMPHDDVDPVVRDIVSAANDRVLWGSDWPHVRASWSTAMPNDGDLANLLQAWVPDPDAREAILVRNPEQLYGFA
jgi:predicted TIM-barrel fold metal-dependent hydrolase